jgi:hypothetical protein
MHQNGELIDVDKILGPSDTHHDKEYARQQALMEVATPGGLSSYAPTSNEKKYLEVPSAQKIEIERIRKQNRFIASIR